MGQACFGVKMSLCNCAWVFMVFIKLLKKVVWVWEEWPGAGRDVVWGSVPGLAPEAEQFPWNVSVLPRNVSVLPRDSSALDPMECMDTAEEQRVHSPPASLVPRIHVILAQKLQHINPLLPACLNEEESKTCECLFPGHLNKYCFAQRPQQQGLDLSLVTWKDHAVLHRMQMFLFMWCLHFYLAEINVIYVEFGLAFCMPEDFTKLFSHKFWFVFKQSCELLEN